MDLVSMTTLAQQAAPSGREMLFNMVPLLLVFVVFYFLLIAPARKRQKTLQAMLDNLKRGDDVITAGGIYGEVQAVEEGRVILRIADNVKVKVAKSAITGLQQPMEKESNS